MKVVAITGPREYEIVDRPMPRAQGTAVVVRIDIAPMCTENKDYIRGSVSDCLGHEAAGTVVETAQPGPLRPGDRVVVMPQTSCGRCALCQSGEYIHCENDVDLLGATGNDAGMATYAQYLIKPDRLLLPIPEDLSTEHASMACCGLGPTFGAMQKMRTDALDTVLISGLGPVGLGGVINAAVRGARVIGVESHPYRRRLALDLGACAVIDPGADDALEQVRALTGGAGADCSIETSGHAEAKRFLVDATRRCGRIALVGWNGSIEASDIIKKGLTIHGTWHWNLHNAPRVFETLRRAAPLLDRLITHRFPLAKVADAWELQNTGECGKVLLYPNA